ncbi:MAG: hypothetical protein ABI548_02095 [Polyangiaceae bacterium]
MSRITSSLPSLGVLLSILYASAFACSSSRVNHVQFPDAGSAGMPDTGDEAGEAGALGGAGQEGGDGGAPNAAAGDGGAAGFEATALKGALSGTIFSDSAPDLVLPRGLPAYAYHSASFTVTIDDVPGLTAEASVDANGNYPYTFPSLPVGTHALHVSLHDLDTTAAQQSYDFFQTATEHASAEVSASKTTVVDVHLKWHWDLHPVSGGAGLTACGDGPRQLYFRDSLHGMIVFRNTPSATGDIGAALVSSDGGVTWTLASATLNQGFLPSEGYPNVFRNRDLYVSPDGASAISLGTGPIARSTDLGVSWARLSFQAPSYGPGDIFYSGLAHSGNALYVGAFTGGVQGSSERTSISQSNADGSAWTTILDRCDVADPAVSCAAPNQPNLPLGFAGFDLACGPTGHCISAGSSNFLVTTDGFQTWSTFGIPASGGCPAADARVIWVPGTSTAWAVARVPTGAGCLGASDQRKITTDGGLTWSAWGPSPVNAVGFTQFADANSAFFVGGDGYVYVSTDAGVTFSNTGPAPSSTGNTATKLDVLDATHVWVAGRTNCSSSTVADVGRWVP